MNRLLHKRVLVTQSTDYMGPAITDLFKKEGAAVTDVPGIVPFGSEFEDYIAELPDFDVIIANLAHDPCNARVADIQNADWHNLFDTMVHPLMALVRHFAPKMATRGHGKVIAVTSAAPLKGLPGSTAYCAARGAQNAFIKAAGLEFAPQNLQINAIAQNQNLISKLSAETILTPHPKEMSRISGIKISKILNQKMYLLLKTLLKIINYIYIT